MYTMVSGNLENIKFLSDEANYRERKMTVSVSGIRLFLINFFINRFRVAAGCQVWDFASYRNRIAPISYIVV